jgi:uncharacterized protein YpmS
VVSPDDLPPASRDEFEKKRRMRNWALFLVLLALAVLFYAMTVVKMTKS